jgi:hypothetical protein
MSHPYRRANYAIAWNLAISHDYVMSGGTRRVIHLPFKHWWLVGGLLLCGLVVAGWRTGWSAGFLAATAVVAGIYVGLPPMAAALQQMPGGGSVSPPPAQEAGGLNGRPTGGAMAWDTRINPVVRALSQVINDPAIIRNIAVMSGISMAFVRSAPDAASYWTTVLDRAQDEGDRRVDSVLNEALARTQNPMVRDAVEAYWKECGR